MRDIAGSVLAVFFIGVPVACFVLYAAIFLVELLFTAHRRYRWLGVATLLVFWASVAITLWPAA